ncbi:RhuM family protein [Roseibium sp. RKSG952]
MKPVQTEGERTVLRDVDYFNLDAIISAGCRVSSKQSIHFGR